MSSRLRAGRDYPYDVPVLARALADPAFHRARLDPRAGGEVVDLRATPGRVVVTVRQPVPSGVVPPAIGRLLTGGLVLVRTEHWRLDDRRLEGDVEVEVPRAPVGADGSMSVTARDGGCRLELDVAVRVHVPFAGALVEPAVVEGIRTLTRGEHDRISAWLAAAEPGGTSATGSAP